MNQTNPTPAFGDIYWIADNFTGFNKVAHPWIVIEDYNPVIPTVKVCVRSTSVQASVDSPHMYAGQQVDHFDRDGWVDPTCRRSLPVDVVASGRYSGRLPPELRQALLAGLRGGPR